jgi:hypothetical protein
MKEYHNKTDWLVDQFAPDLPATRRALHAWLGSWAGHRAHWLNERRWGVFRPVVLVQSQEFGNDDDEERWSLICDVHGSITTDRSQTVLRWHGSGPEYWCEDCMAEVEQTG